MALPQADNITLYRGDDWAQFYQLTLAETGLPVDLTGSQIQAQIRQSVLSPTTVGEFIVSMRDDPNGKFELSLTSAMTAGLVLTGAAVYDVQIVSAGGIVKTYLQGTLNLTPDVTR